jgi:hypothetical protein
MRVLALIECPDHVCYRYRIAAFSEALRARGMTLTAEPLQHSGLPRWRQFLALRQVDVVVLQRKVLSLSQTWLLRRCAKRLVFDFDDAVFQRDSFSRKGSLSWQRTARFHSMVAAADTVLAGNDYLAGQAAERCDPAKVHVIPTCVNPALYPLSSHRRRGAEVQLAWIGSSSTLRGLRWAQPWLTAVGQQLPGIGLRLICDATLDTPDVHVMLRPWSSETEGEELAEADVGVSWLPDDSFTQGKCGLKVLQYMAAGLPVVTNPVGVHPEFVVPGETGYLVSQPDEWAAAISRLATDPELRRRMGQAGRRRVEQLYSVARWSDRFADLVAGCDTRVKLAG